MHQVKQERSKRLFDKTTKKPLSCDNDSANQPGHCQNFCGLFTPQADPIATRTQLIARQRQMTGSSFAQRRVFGWAYPPQAARKQRHPKYNQIENVGCRGGSETHPYGKQSHRINLFALSAGSDGTARMYRRSMLRHYERGTLSHRSAFALSTTKLKMSDVGAGLRPAATENNPARFLWLHLVFWKRSA